jgi:hypothetical protein
MAEYREHDLEKVSGQPLAHDPTFVSPSTDDDGATGFVMTVYCPTTPADGDVAVYVAANTRFELQPQSSISDAVTASDGAGGFTLVFAEDGSIVTT